MLSKTAHLQTLLPSKPDLQISTAPALAPASTERRALGFSLRFSVAFVVDAICVYLPEGEWLSAIADPPMA
jgi:hypothetical protein